MSDCMRHMICTHACILHCYGNHHGNNRAPYLTMSNYPTRDSAKGGYYLTRDSARGGYYPTRDSARGGYYPTRDSARGVNYPTRDSAGGLSDWFTLSVCLSVGSLPFAARAAGVELYTAPRLRQ